MKMYDPMNWYWFVGSDTAQVYSSRVGDYVPVTDESFVAWSEDGTLATIVDSEAYLGEVLAPHQARPTTAAILDGYQEAQAKGMVIHVNFKVLFNILKRINALEGKPVLTAAQARAYVKALL